MSGHQTFWPYHPRRVRYALVGGAIVALALFAWALASARAGGGPQAWARAGVTCGLLLSMLYVHLKLAPKQGWGVEVGPMALKVSRATAGEIEVPYAAVKEVRHGGGAKKDALILFVEGDRRVMVPRHLFATREEFEALVKAVEERLPPAKLPA